MNRIKNISRKYASHRPQMDELRRRRKIQRAAARMDGIFAGTRVLLQKEKVADLKKMCKDRGITGYSKMKKDQLIEVILQKMVEDADAA